MIKPLTNGRLPRCRWTKNHSGPTDWGIVTPPQSGLNGKECRLPRGRLLGGSSGTNGTICVRGVKQDYDDWGFPEWSGDEMFRAMKKVCHRDARYVFLTDTTLGRNFPSQGMVSARRRRPRIRRSTPHCTRIATNPYRRTHV